ncbi:hypothetical protein [Roseiconus lacunae]|uniref:hypothetical protein n=1 Tax=Roseiconus lacunae TaxID=2605694 RepID=UPI001E2E3E6F|nr:hypothetical protein [Roseiconus lacunae]
MPQSFRYREKFHFVPSTEIGEVDRPMLKYLIDCFDYVKSQRTTLAQKNQDALINQKDLLTFEKAYLKQGMSWEDTKKAILNNSKNGIEILGTSVNDIRRIISKKTSKELGRVYLENERFKCVSESHNSKPSIFVRQDHPNQRQYIKTQAGHFVRRYVIRGLNHTDSINLDMQKGLEPPEQNSEAKADETNATKDHAHRHPVQTGETLDEGSQIISHTRGWKKRFVSTTSTDRSVLSTQLEEFRSVFGAVIVDLAEINASDIIDLHSPNAASRTFGFAIDVIMKLDSVSPAMSFRDEKIRAFRDVIRTREILIRSVPFTAVKFLSAAETVVGVCWDKRCAELSNVTNGLKEATIKALQKHFKVEPLKYFSNGGYWYFFGFDSAQDCGDAYRLLTNDPGAKKFLKIEKLKSFVPRSDLRNSQFNRVG